MMSVVGGAEEVECAWAGAGAEVEGDADTWGETWGVGRLDIAFSSKVADNFYPVMEFLHIVWVSNQPPSLFKLNPKSNGGYLNPRGNT